MAAGTNPIYARTPDNQWGATDGNGGAAGPLKTQNTALDGTGTVLTVFTADATEGGPFNRLVIRPAGTNIATVLRIWLNNGSTNATIANNVAIGEISLAATTASATLALQDYTWTPPGGQLPMMAGHKINVTLGTTVAGGYSVSGYGGKF